MGGGRHFTSVSKVEIQEGVASLGLDFTQYAKSLVAIATSNLGGPPVKSSRETELGGDAVTQDSGGKELPRPRRYYLPDPGVRPLRPPRKGKKRHFEPGSPSFHRPLEALPNQARGTQGVFTPLLSSFLDLQSPTGSSP